MRGQPRQRPRSSRRRLVDIRPAHAADRGLSGEEIGFRARRVLAERGRTAGDDQVGGLRRPWDRSERHHLQGVNLHVSGEKLITVATDTVRLAVKSCPLPDGAAGMPRVTVPTEAASAMVDILKDVEGDAELAVFPQLIELRLPNLRLASSLIDGAFPDYQRVMPAINGAAARFRVCALAEAVARVDIVRLSDVNKRATILRLTTRDGAICLEAGAAGGEQALEIVEAETRGCSFSFGVVADYLAEMLDVWPGDAELGVQQSSPSSPILFMADERPSESHLIMPSVLKS